MKKKKKTQIEIRIKEILYTDPIFWLVEYTLT